MLYVSTVISTLMRQNQRLAQDIAYLNWRLDKLDDRAA
jgi:hypothetical protein